MSFIIILLLFFAYSFLGWVCECIYCSIPKRKWINRGMLSGPYCPIYGFGSIFIVLLLYPYKNKPFLIFVLAILITSLLEYVTSYVLEVLFHTKWWDYTGYFMNINGRVCIRNSLLFGILGLAVMYLINPVIVDLFRLIPSTFALIIVCCIVYYFTWDVFTVVKGLLKDNREWAELEAIISHYFSNKRYDNKGSLKEDLQRMIELLPFDIQGTEVFSEIKRRYNEFIKQTTKTRRHLRKAYPNAIFGRNNKSSIIRMIIDEFKNDNKQQKKENETENN